MDNLKQIIKINNKKQVQAHNKQMYQTQYKILKQMKIIKTRWQQASCRKYFNHGI